MNNLFKFVFSVFFLSGVIVFGTLFCGMINEGLLKLFGSVIIFSNQTFESYLSFFKICRVIMVLTFPTAIIKVFANGLANPSEKGIGWFIVIFVLFMFVIPVILMLNSGNYQSSAIWTIAWIAGLIIGGNAKYKFPFEN